MRESVRAVSRRYASIYRCARQSEFCRAMIIDAHLRRRRVYNRGSND